MTEPDPNDALLNEFYWLQKHPHFNERPASVDQFLGEGYLNIAALVRPGLRQALIDMFGEEVNPTRIAIFQKAMFTGAIGVGKTTMASIVISYMCHWTLCLKDPQAYYNLLPGSRIAFMQMSTSEDQAVETVFGDIKARIENSKWFVENFPFDPKFTKQIRFDKNIWVLPGSSLETSFEGYNILGGILDEADSHKQTKDKDYADVGRDTIENRIKSRYKDRGFFLVIGQMKKAGGFAAKTFKEFQTDERAYAIRMTLWESFGWDQYLKDDGTRDSFWYDVKRKNVITAQAAYMIRSEKPDVQIIEVPNEFLIDFTTKPEKALKDLAGIPPNAGDAFISLSYKIDEAVERWKEGHPGMPSPVTPDPISPQFLDWFRAQTPLKRHLHIDFAYSPDGDALGMAMGHVKHIITDDEGEMKPYVSFDFLMRVKAAPGSEIMFSGIRSMVYDLKRERAFRIRQATLDGFQSTDTRQQFRKNRIPTEMLSVDKSKLAYEDLRDALYENRIEFPPYMTKLEMNSTEEVMIAVKELMELEENDKKIDHPVSGSKDVADCIAAVTSSLMGDRAYHRGIRSNPNDTAAESNGDSPPPISYSQSGNRLQHLMPTGLQAPAPPSSIPGFGSIPTVGVPPGLMPGRDR